jgi:hypothetical protein
MGKTTNIPVHTRPPSKPKRKKKLLNTIVPLTIVVELVSIDLKTFKRGGKQFWFLFDNKLSDTLQQQVYNRSDPKCRLDFSNATDEVMAPHF